MRTPLLRTPLEARPSTLSTERKRPANGPSIGGRSASVLRRPAIHGVPATLTEGIVQAPADAGPLAAVSAGLVRASTALGPANRALGPRIKAAIDSSVELQERAALKNIGLAAAMTVALRERGVPEPMARLASELGVLALKRGYAAWSEGGRQAGNDWAPHALAALEELRAASLVLFG